jgi:SAM-dependent methyltransferase
MAAGEALTVLTDEQDAFGAALLAHHEGRNDGRILMLEVDDGRAMPAMAPPEFFKAPSEWFPWEVDILEDLEGPVLDLGCGAGRHALYLQTQSLAVTGVDVSPGAVDVCRRRGVRDVRLADLRTPPDDERWGSVLLMCGNLGLAGGWDETRELLNRLHGLCPSEAEQRRIAQVHDSLGSAAFEDAFTSGKQIHVDDAVDYGLDTRGTRLGAPPLDA